MLLTNPRYSMLLTKPLCYVICYAMLLTNPLYSMLLTKPLCYSMLLTKTSRLQGVTSNNTPNA
jgi:hypothetical protein